MKAQIINAFGEPSVFTMVDLSIPEIKPGHLLIKVYASSVNPIDCKVRSGAVSSVAPEFPAILQGDVAGVVEAIGEDIKQFKKGDEIYGFAGGFRGLGGALAEYMLVDEKLIAKKSKLLSMREAAALPLVSITTWMALFEKAKLTKEMHILIHGGVGGVGHIAVQLAKWCGAKVYTTVRKDEDFAIAKSLGADEIINVQKENVEEYTKRLTDGQGFEMIFDTVGGANLNNSFAAAALNGTIVTIAARSTNDLSLMHNKGLSLHCILTLLPLLNNQNREAYGNILEKVTQIVDEGKLKPLIDSSQYTLAEADQAHALLESGNANGKVVITVSDSILKEVESF
jgi:NADPH2:quinone reductase